MRQKHFYVTNFLFASDESRVFNKESRKHCLHCDEGIKYKVQLKHSLHLEQRRTPNEKSQQKLHSLEKRKKIKSRKYYYTISERGHQKFHYTTIFSLISGTSFLCNFCAKCSSITEAVSIMLKSKFENKQKNSNKNAKYERI